MSELLTFQALDRAATLRIDSPDLSLLGRHLHSSARIGIETVSSHAPSDIAWTGEGDDRFKLDLFDKPWGAGFSRESLFFQSENLITQIFSDRHREKLQLHAAGVVSPAGEGCLIIGESSTGKTSLTLALLLEGWRWLSDEMILIDPHALDRALGLPRNFNLKEPSFPAFPETSGLPHGLEIRSPRRQCQIRFVDPNVLRPGAWSGSAPVNRIFFPKYNPELAAPGLIPVAGVELSGRLVSSFFRPQPWAMEWVLRVVGGSPAWELSYHDARAAAREIHQWFRPNTEQATP